MEFKLSPAAKEITEEEWREKLIDFTIVPEDLWPKIISGMQIRYIKKDNTRATGGFTINQFDKDGDKFIRVSNTFNKKAKFYKEFNINLTTVKKIYKRIDSRNYIEISRLNSIIKDFHLKFIQLEKRMARLEKK